MKSIYLPYDTEQALPSKKLEKVMNLCLKEKEYFLARLDYKSHHVELGSSNTSTRA